MNVCENEAVIAFDTLYTQNHIQILKILLPYFDPYGQSHLAVWIKYLELRYTLEYVSRHPSPPYKNQTSGTSSPDFAVLFEQIKNFCSPREKALFGELLNLQKNLELFEEKKRLDVSLWLYDVEDVRRKVGSLGDETAAAKRMLDEADGELEALEARNERLFDEAQQRRRRKICAITVLLRSSSRAV